MCCGQCWLGLGRLGKVLCGHHWKLVPVSLPGYCRHVGQGQATVRLSTEKESLRDEDSMGVGKPQAVGRLFCGVLFRRVGLFPSTSAQMLSVRRTLR